jgi:peptidyl-prolyl cis-trans isomerase D
VLGQVIADRTLDNEASQLGLSAGDARVLSQIVQIPAFRGLDGEFDREAYAFALGRRGQTEESFETSLREGIARSILQSAVIGGTPDPISYAEAMVGYIGERRTFTWATLGGDALGSDVPTPTEAEVQAHYEAFPGAYTTPEARQISYAWVTPDMLQDQVEVDDGQVREIYDDRIAEFVTPERRLTERLVFPDTATAEAALATVTDGTADFDDLVAGRGLDLTDVDMGDVSRDDLGAAADAVFAAEPGDTLGPFDTDLGPALFRMNAVLTAQETTYEEARDGLRDELATARARRLIGDMRDDISDLLAGGAALEDLADRTDLQLGDIEWTADATDGIAAYDAFRAAAAVATDGAFPELVELSDGGLFVLRLDGITPPALRPLDDVRAQVTQDRAAAATQEAVVEQTAQLVRELATTGNFSDLGLDPTLQENLIRRDFVAGTPEGFMGLVFSMEMGDINTMETPDGTIIVRLDSIDTANLMDPAMETERASIAERAGSGIAQDLYATFAREVQLRTDVTINEAAVAQINSQFR